MNMKRINFLVMGALLSSVALTSTPALAGSGDAALRYWTPARMHSAKPLAVTVDRHSGIGHLTVGRSAATSTLGASWPDDNAMMRVTGRVFFTSGGTNYSCSGSVLTDSVSTRSIVLTAGHCVFKQQGAAFYKNWVFIPAYDRNPQPRTSCTATDPALQFPYGCWTARSLVVGSGYASAKKLTTSALQSDWGFAVVTTGGLDGATQLDTAVGASLPLAVPGFTATGQQAYALGYPAAYPYSGGDLVYCAGTIGADARAKNSTWSLGCNMTGGSSGGPWISAYNPATGLGGASSLNSYGYGSAPVMYGPKFTSSTTACFATATTVALGTNAKA